MANIVQQGPQPNKSLLLRGKMSRETGAAFRARLLSIKLDGGNHTLHDADCSEHMLDSFVGRPAKHEMRLAELIDPT